MTARPWDMLASTPSFASFISQTTRLGRPALCPEIRLHLGDDLAATWDWQERQLGERGGAPPYWSLTWPGGQALARYVLDNPALVAGRRVLDLGSGSGLCAIAAALGAARRVEASDIDPHACEASTINARCNDVVVEALCEDLIGSPAGRWDVVLAADLWYERFLAQRVNGWLREMADDGVLVLMGDLGRAYLPRRGLQELSHYDVPTPEGLERGAVSRASVFRFECLPTDGREGKP